MAANRRLSRVTVSWASAGVCEPANDQVTIRSPVGVAGARSRADRDPATTTAVPTTTTNTTTAAIRPTRARRRERRRSAIDSDAR